MFSLFCHLSYLLRLAFDRFFSFSSCNTQHRSVKRRIITDRIMLNGAKIIASELILICVFRAAGLKRSPTRSGTCQITW